MPWKEGFCLGALFTPQYAELEYIFPPRFSRDERVAYVSRRFGGEDQALVYPYHPSKVTCYQGREYRTRLELFFTWDYSRDAGGYKYLGGLVNASPKNALCIGSSVRDSFFYPLQVV